MNIKASDFDTVFSINQHKKKAKTKNKELAYCLDNVKSDGLHLEFGVYRGRSISFCANYKPDRHFYGFDSFEGFPESFQWNKNRKYTKGDYSSQGIPNVPQNVTLIKGFFEKSLPGWWEENKESIAFINIDCDLYSGCLFVLNCLDNYIGDTVIRFDELCQWSSGSGASDYTNWKEGEYKALMEWSKEKKRKFVPLCRTDLQSGSILVL